MNHIHDTFYKGSGWPSLRAVCYGLDGRGWIFVRDKGKEIVSSLQLSDLCSIKLNTAVWYRSVEWSNSSATLDEGECSDYRPSPLKLNQGVPDSHKT